MHININYININTTTIGKLNAKFAGRKALNFVNGKIPVGFMEKFT